MIYNAQENKKLTSAEKASLEDLATQVKIAILDKEIRIAHRKIKQSSRKQRRRKNEYTKISLLKPCCWNQKANDLDMRKETSIQSF